MAVWFIVLFFEGALIQLLQAKCTNKMFWVKLPMHCCDASSSDGFLTVVAQSTTFRVVMHFTVRFSLMFKETSTWKWLMAFLEVKYITQLNI